MPAGRVTAAGELELVVGIDFEALGVACLEVPDGEHVLVAGPPRSGRTHGAAPAGHVVGRGRVRASRSWPSRHAVAPSCPSWPVVVEADAPTAVAAVEAAVGRPCLLVVDDAEHVDDPRLGGARSPSGDPACSSSPPAGRRRLRTHVRALDLGGPPQPARAAVRGVQPTPTVTCWVSCCRGTGRCRPGRVWPGWSAAAGGAGPGRRVRRSAATALDLLRRVAAARGSARRVDGFRRWSWRLDLRGRGSPPAMTACGPCAGPSARRSSPPARRRPGWRPRSGPC